MKLENVKIVNFNKTIANADVLIENGKIKTITEKEGEGTITLIPGFIDTHTHGGAGYDFMDGKEATEKISEAFTEFGVTSIYATIMTRDMETMYTALEEIAKAESKGANILGIHSEGPFLAPEKKGAHKLEELKRGDLAILKKMFDASHGKLKKISYAPEVVSDDFIKMMVELKIMPSVGHTFATYERTMEAIELGSLECCHLWNAMTGVENRNPGAAEAILTDDRIMAEIIADFVHVDKATLLFTLKNKGPKFITLITDSIRPAGLPDGESESGGTVIVKKGPKIVLKGTDTIAGSGGTMHINFKNVLSLGVTMEEAVMMTSYNSAKSLMLKGKGYIQEGMDADLLLIRNDLSIEKTIVGGEVKYSS
ncbi:MAG: N-acetylglucosamine-6-phosphate deacetylase [Mycoplasmataceae bacterium]|nr:N-acetylglucosamine-6-phosphate deacetylase [Mycoplasmataceae bacterium]